jgi:Regulator of ribonuclease activity B
MLSFLFRRRDLKLFPKDEYGDLLYAFAKQHKVLPEKAMVAVSGHFDNEADANAFATSQINQGHEIFHDHDEDYAKDGLGIWCVDVEIPVSPTYHEVKRAIGRLRNDVQSFRGKASSWVVVQWVET